MTNVTPEMELLGKLWSEKVEADQAREAERLRKIAEADAQYLYNAHVLIRNKLDEIVPGLRELKPSVTITDREPRPYTGIANATAYRFLVSVDGWPEPIGALMIRNYTGAPTFYVDGDEDRLLRKWEDIFRHFTSKNADPKDVVEIRVFRDENSDGPRWCIDAVDRYGRYTDDVWGGNPTKRLAVSKAEEYRTYLGISRDVPIVVRQESPDVR
jgi:hypothetical protein